MIHRPSRAAHSRHKRKIVLLLQPLWATSKMVSSICKSLYYFPTSIFSPRSTRHHGAPGLWSAEFRSYWNHSANGSTSNCNEWYTYDQLTSKIHGISSTTLRFEALVFNRDMMMDVPLIANLATIRDRRQHLIDENLRQQNAKRIEHRYQVNGRVMVHTVDPTLHCTCCSYSGRSFGHRLDAPSGQHNPSQRPGGHSQWTP